MRRFWRDKVAIPISLIGVGLMLLTILWRINPAEGSVVPTFLTGSATGRVVIGVLLVTCMPAWIIAVSVCYLLPFPEEFQYALACVSMLVFQGLGYFMIGKLLSVGVRRIKGRKTPQK